MSEITRNKILAVDFDDTIAISRFNEETKETYKFSQSMFLQRRKTIFNNLKSYLRDDTKAKEVLASCGIEPTRRPDAISPLEYLSLYRATKRVQ